MIDFKQTNSRIEKLSFLLTTIKRDWGILFSVCRQSHDGRTQSNEKSGNIQKILGVLKGSLVRWLVLDGREPCSGELNGSLPQRR
jgi:hypothetical protein